MPVSTSSVPVSPRQRDCGQRSGDSRPRTDAHDYWDSGCCLLGVRCERLKSWCLDSGVTLYVSKRGVNIDLDVLNKQRS